MNWCDERLGLGADAEPSYELMAEKEAVIAGLPLEDLVRAWREINTVPYPVKSAGCWCFDSYFDGLGQNDPARAVAFIEAALAGEPDDAVVALIAEGKLLMQLLHSAAPQVAGPLVEVALRQPRLRWLLGGVAWTIEGGMVKDGTAKRRLLAIADEAAYRAWKATRDPAPEAVDLATLPLPDLASRWITMNARSPVERSRDEGASQMFDYQQELVRNEPDKALALVKEILRQEPGDALLGILAAGLLEDLIPAQEGPLFDTIEAEAQCDPRFRHLLGGVWTHSMSPAVIARLAKVTDHSGW